jgi:HAD superfamily hydrolase (TIGR01509 family)
MTIKGVIVDIDGTLVDSNDYHAKAWVRAFQEFGYLVAPEQVRPLIGMGGDQIIPRLIKISERSDIAKAISKRRSEIFRRYYLPWVRKFPKSRELLLKLLNEGLKFTIGTSSEPEDARALLKTAQINDLVRELPPHPHHSKPAPDVIMSAINFLNLQPFQCIMLGDTPHDIKAASKAGVKTIAFRTGGWNDENLSGAIAIYDGPEDLLNHFNATILAQGRKVRAVFDAPFSLC